MKLTGIKKFIFITLEFSEDEIQELLKFVETIELSRLTSVPPKVHGMLATLHEAVDEKPA